MGAATNRGASDAAGSYATSRRGGLTLEEIRQIEAHRAKDRPTPWQALSAMFGRTVEDLKAMFGEIAAIPLPEIGPAQPPAPIEPDFAWDARALRLSSELFRLDVGAPDIAKIVGCTLPEARRRIAVLTFESQKDIAA